MTVQTNADKLVIVSVAGTIVHPSFPGLPAEPYRLAADGTPFLLPTYGGIVYNISVGDSAYGWLADCVHPGVSIHYGSELGNRGLNIYACVGNDAVVMTGEGKGTKGVVTGKSGRFSEHVIVHFPKAARSRFAVGDKIVIRSEGVGLAIDGFPDMRIKSLSPKLVKALSPEKSTQNGRGCDGTADQPHQALDQGEKIERSCRSGHQIGNQW